MDRDEAYREIQEMVRQGILIPPRRPGRGARYRLMPEILQAKRWLESRIPSLREFFREHEVLKNADYRALYDLPRYRAVTELRRLTEDGYLILEGGRRGARYRPGPRLGAGGRE